MTYSVNSQVKMAVALIAGAMAVSTLFMMFVAGSEGFWFLLLMTLVTGYVALAAWSFRNSVALNKDTGTVTYELGFVGFQKKERYRLSAFSQVGIVMGGRSRAGGGASTVYSVQLIGSPNVKLPGGGTDLGFIEREAARVAEYLELPLDTKPAMGFFNHRL